ncbi:MAG: HAD-IA family hydrolase [Acidobacteriota bacterium]
MTWRNDSRAAAFGSAGGGNPAPVAAVTFDVTRTLIHCPRLAEIYAEVLRRHGLRAPAHEIRRRIPLVWQELSCLASQHQDRFSTHPDGAEGWWRRFVERLCEHLALPRPSRFATAELFARFGHADAWELFADVLPCLQRLRRLGVRLGVVSNWDHRLPALLDELELTPFFDSITFSSACGLEKPHPRIFLACLEELGTSAEQTLHVGDSALEDVEGAEAVGMLALRVERTPACDLWQMVRPMLRRPLDA